MGEYLQEWYWVITGGEVRVAVEVLTEGDPDVLGVVRFVALFGSDTSGFSLFNKAKFIMDSRLLGGVTSC
jgi:hypothetical protein